MHFTSTLKILHHIFIIIISQINAFEQYSIVTMTLHHHFQTESVATASI